MRFGSFRLESKKLLYYIEYINQTYETNLQNTLNHSDAVLFIYTKTILILKTKYFLISYSSISPPSWLRPLLPSPFSLKLHGLI